MGRLNIARASLMQFLCTLVGTAATVFTLQCAAIAPAHAQSCNTNSSWLLQYGTINIGDQAIFGPGCGQITTGGPAPVTCAALGAVVVGTGAANQCSTVAASTVHVGANSDIYDFWIARPSAIAGTILQMQDGKGGNLRILSSGTAGINFQSLINTNNPGFPYTALSLDTDCQAGNGGGCVGINISTQVSNSWNGPGPLDGVSPINTLGKTARGANAWGANFVCWTLTVAANACYGVELDVQNQIAGTAQASGIWLVNKNSVVPAAGSVALISATANGVGFPTAGLYFSNIAGFFPLTSAASVIKTDAGTVTNGIDLSALTISGNAYASNGFTVNGSGTLNAVQGSFTQFVSAGFLANTTGSLRLVGLTSGVAQITAQAVAGTPTLTVGTTSGTIAASASAPLSIAAATGVISCATCALTTGTLAQFAATTSAQLAGVISDETGTAGKLVFDTSPTFQTAVTVNGNTANIQIIGGTGAGQGGYFGVGQSGLVHSVAIEKVILGGASTNLLLYADGASASGIDIYTNNLPRIAIAGATGVVSFPAAVAATTTATGTLVVGGGGGFLGAVYVGNEIVSGITAVGTLPACGAARKAAIYFVTDSNAVSYTAGIGAVVAAGGATQVPVRCDGTNWRIGSLQEQDRGANDNFELNRRKFA